MLQTVPICKMNICVNKIRLNILPMLRELNPSVSESIAETSRRLTDVSLIYNKEIEAGKERVMEKSGHILISRLMEESAPAALLFEILHPVMVQFCPGRRCIPQFVCPVGKKVCFCRMGGTARQDGVDYSQEEAGG